MSVDFGALLREQEARARGEQCPAGWVTREWDPELASKVMVDHRCALAPHATGNHRDAAGNVRVRFEE